MDLVRLHHSLTGRRRSSGAAACCVHVIAPPALASARKAAPAEHFLWAASTASAHVLARQAVTLSSGLIVDEGNQAASPLEPQCRFLAPRQTPGGAVAPSGSPDLGCTPRRFHEERAPARRVLPFGLAVLGPVPGRTGRSPQGTVLKSAQAEDVTQTSAVHDEVSKTDVALRRTPDINDTRIGVTADHDVNTPYRQRPR